MFKYRLHRKNYRPHTFEQLCVRSLLASDLNMAVEAYESMLDNESLNSGAQTFLVDSLKASPGEILADGHWNIPKEPDDLVQRDRDYYAALSARGDFSSFAPLSETFVLHSRPTASKTIYIDFDGNTTIGTSWNIRNNVTTIRSPAYDPDGNGASFTSNELRRIQGIWQRVAADFSAFDVNVTTQDPGVDALVNTGGSDSAWGIRVVVTIDNFANSGAGGFAYINSFNWGFESVGATDTPCFVFNVGEIGVSAAVSHEIGHALGLSHDGTTASHPSQPRAEYYNGHGTAETSWGPIMGSGYYANVTTWDAGEYFGTSNTGSTANYGRGATDIDIISTFNGFGVRLDDHGNNSSTASEIDYLGLNISDPSRINVSKFGTIERSNDLDFIRFETGTGMINLTIDPYVTEVWTPNNDGTFNRTVESSFFGTSWSNNQGSNLDVEAKLYDVAGNLIATSNPLGLAATFSNLNLSLGTYFISVDGVGFGAPPSSPPTGYTDYGSIGQYLLSGTIAVLGVQVDLESGMATYVENSQAVPLSPAATFSDSLGVNYGLLTMTASIISNAEPTDQLSIISIGSGVGQISTDNNQVRFGGVVVGLFTQLPNLLSVKLTANASRLAVEALIRSIGYSSSSDGPSTLPRRVEVSFGLGVADARDVAIVTTNDSPSLVDVTLPLIDEDSPQPVGRPIDLLFAGGFVDPDAGAYLTGIAVVENSADVNSEGIWLYSSNQGASWTPVGSVDDANNSLLISAASWLGFQPVPNFYGTPKQPLLVRALDNTFADSFSNSVNDVRKYLDLPTRFVVNGSVSSGTGRVFARVRNINDPPVATQSALQISAVQDQAVNYVFPTNPELFVDIDSVNLTWTLQPIGIPQVPAWLNLDTEAYTLTGTPRNSDVGQFEFLLRATDSGGASATIPLSIDVANINDAPQIQDLRGRLIKENEVGAKIGLLVSFDPDPKDIISYTVSDDRFIIREGVLYLQSSAFIDFETEPEVALTVTARDNGSPPLATSETYVLTVQDQNEYFPTFSSQDFLIPYVRADHQVLGSVFASDQDTKQTVKYKVQQDDAGIFEIDAASGEVRLKLGAQISATKYRLFIAAYDDGTPSNSRVVLFNVNVEVPNLFSPVVTNGQNLTVLENSSPGTSVGKVIASDGDGDTNLRYFMNSAQFKIDATTGMVTVANGAKLNFETLSTYIVQVDVTDSGSPLRTTSQAVTITLEDQNDPPQAIALANPKVPTLQKGLQLSNLLVTDEDPAVLYVYSTNDPRFEIRNNGLAMRQNAFLDASLGGNTISVPITVTDATDTTVSATLPLTIEVISNPFPWQNRNLRLDVNRDGLVSALDALLVINALSPATLGRGPLSVPREFSQLSLFDIDTSGDNFLSPLDASLVINAISAARRAAAEGEIATSPDRSLAPSAWFDAYTSLENERKRRSS